MDRRDLRVPAPELEPEDRFVEQLALLARESGTTGSSDLPRSGWRVAVVTALAAAVLTATAWLAGALPGGSPLGEPDPPSPSPSAPGTPGTTTSPSPTTDGATRPGGSAGPGSGSSPAPPSQSQDDGAGSPRPSGSTPPGSSVPTPSDLPTPSDITPGAGDRTPGGRATGEPSVGASVSASVRGSLRTSVGDVGPLG